ncbi:uncharacterized protein DFL_007605 [Arthrobotrys flagrans]|uniref:CBM1 domain-containing protein n=1 Tax=Arthrobotrys flagrans TaxID=97331 RepID=A0A436ZWE0_ARTFL|nr:hypothetical protein DFL_007605 [Arthrobotrys flagrans]
MRFTRPALLLTACLLETSDAWGLVGKAFNLLGYSPRGYFGNTKRDLDSLPGGFDGLEARDFSPAENKPLQKRGKSCDCVETTTASYGLTSLEPYMATPFGRCDVSAKTSNLCPTDYNCVCQDSTLSRCLPTSTVSNTECTTYTGASVLPKVTFWWLSSTLEYGADPSGQCGGTKQPSATTSWDPQKTDCPRYQACACQQPGYSVCVDTSASDFTGTSCPNTCKYQFKVSLPPPSATAKIGGQCGGTCWTGPTNCPAGATCFTETSPSPGAYAMCHTTKPAAVRKLRLKERGEEGINVPAKVQARATPIYF